MSLETPQDLTNSLSILLAMQDYAKTTNDVNMLAIVNQYINQYNKVIIEPDSSDLTMLPYNRKDAYSILEYLKLQAEQLSDGRWTDFSDADIGTVFLKILSYLSDMNNFQIDKTASELYLKTATERSSAIAMASLLGYEPRHYMSASTDITITNVDSRSIEDGTIIPTYSTFTTLNSEVQYTTLEEFKVYNNKAIIKAYEGTPSSLTYNISNITTLGRIALPSYYIGVNTIQVYINGVEWTKVDDVRFVAGELAFSVHCSENQYLYIQLPSYWTDLITSGSSIIINYLISSGESGRIGKNVLSKIGVLNSDQRAYMQIYSNTASEGGYDPETVDEMRITLPKYARTMNTIVTINDFEEVGTNVLGIADISALDYNDPSSGLLQPQDYYKVYMYVLPDADSYDPSDSEQLKYRNTIIKQRDDWNIVDMSRVAKEVETKSQSSIIGNTISFEGLTNTYNNISDIVPTIDTGIESTSYVIPVVSDLSSTNTLSCTININTELDNITITLSNNWRSYLNSTDKFAIYFKQDQVLTDKGQALRDYIDKKRLASLNVTYHELDIVQPTIKIDIYMDKYDTHFDSVATMVKEFILEKYSRANLKIGEPIFASVIGSDILTQFKFIRYCEIREPEEKIEVLPRGFIDVIPNYMDEQGELHDKIIINVHDYQNRVI